MGRQFGVQFGAIVATVAYTAVVSYVILRVVDALMGLRVNADEEQQGLDVVLHDESGYRL